MWTFNPRDIDKVIVTIVTSVIVAYWTQLLKSSCPVGHQPYRPSKTAGSRSQSPPRPTTPQTHFSIVCPLALFHTGVCKKTHPFQRIQIRRFEAKSLKWFFKTYLPRWGQVNESEAKFLKKYSTRTFLVEWQVKNNKRTHSSKGFFLETQMYLSSWWHVPVPGLPKIPNIPNCVFICKQAS